MTLAALLAEGVALLDRAGIPGAEIDARLLLQQVTGYSRSGLMLHGSETAARETVARYRRLLARRADREPVQYILGEQEFWSLDFVVSPSVLIPRPETEFVLEQALAACTGGGVVRALDLGTGSGVIAVVLARELGCRVTAVDLSPAALMVAARNLARHGVAGRVHLVCGDLFAPLVPVARYDLLVSNPPYIVEAEIDRLEPEVSRAEPRLALDGGVDGLACIRRIAAAAHCYVRPGGWVFLEIGADQRETAARLFPVSLYDAVGVIDDWAGRPRVVRARVRPSP
ncbi:MAG: peptide chain release factor N(5)-glutamine methyltransferase [Desulfobulbus sp.]|jgi:release factor glutamine methyltransferase